MNYNKLDRVYNDITNTALEFDDEYSIDTYSLSDETKQELSKYDSRDWQTLAEKLGKSLVMLSLKNDASLRLCKDGFILRRSKSLFYPADNIAEAGFNWEYFDPDHTDSDPDSEYVVYRHVIGPNTKTVNRIKGFDKIGD